MKERTQTSTEMRISCQRNGHWAATSHLSGRGLVQPIKELSSAAGRCAGRGCALIRQLANYTLHYVLDIAVAWIITVGLHSQGRCNFEVGMLKGIGTGIFLVFIWKWCILDSAFLTGATEIAGVENAAPDCTHLQGWKTRE